MLDISQFSLRLFIFTLSNCQDPSLCSLVRIQKEMKWVSIVIVYRYRSVFGDS